MWKDPSVCLLKALALHRSLKDFFLCLLVTDCFRPFDHPPPEVFLWLTVVGFHAFGYFAFVVAIAWLFGLSFLHDHWTHLFVSIQYHDFLQSAIWKIVQTKQNKLVQLTESWPFAQILVDKKGGAVIR